MPIDFVAKITEFSLDVNNHFTFECMKTEAEEFDGCNGEEDHDCFTEDDCCAERTAYIGDE